MPVSLPGCQCNRFLRWGMFLEMIPAQRACRMRLARRQRIEGCETLESHARDDRLQTWVAWNGLQPLLTAVELRRNMQHKMRLYGGELSRSPPYASILPLRSVKGPLRQASPALDPVMALPRECREGL